MPAPSRRRKQLENELLALGEDAMLLEQLDGFVAGLLVGPDLIKPGEWLPLIWGGEEAESSFADLDHANRVLQLIMEYYNSVARTLMERPDRYRPLFAVDDRNGDILWELWIEGFEKAVKLRPAAWQQLLDADVDTAAATAGLLLLADIVGKEPGAPRPDHDVLAAAPGRIAQWIVTLNAWRLANQRPTPTNEPKIRSPFTPAGKVGRNDPCPCGSGKKYKKCCGLN